MERRLSDERTSEWLRYHCPVLGGTALTQITSHKGRDGKLVADFTDCRDKHRCGIDASGVVNWNLCAARNEEGARARPAPDGSILPAA